MAKGIESRAPFLDYRLVEYVFSLPSNYKISNGWTKHILRKAVSDVVPREIAFRIDKKGFVAPEAVWATGVLKKNFEHWLVQAVDNSNGFIEPSILDWFNEMCTKKASYDSYIWKVISLGQWLETYSVKI